MREKWVPFEYQKQSVRWMLSKRFGNIWLKMGRGKTAIVLFAIRALLDRLEVSRVLIIAPKRVALSTWPRELKKWQGLEWLSYTNICEGENKKQRKELAMRNTWIHIINYENVRWLVENVPWRWDMVITDEHTRLKHATTQRYTALDNIRLYVRRWFGLTGTPSPNGYLDLWGQYYILDRGKRLGTDIGAYRDRWFFSEDEDRRVWHMLAWAKEQIQERIQDITLALPDSLDVPPVHNLVREIEIPGELMDTYRQLERDMLLRYAEGDVVARNAAVLTSKCQQFCNGVLYMEPKEEGGKKETKAVHDEKLDELENLLDEADGGVLIVYTFVPDRDRILKRFPQVKVLDQKGQVEAAWNRGEVEALAVHPQSAGYGIDLQHGGKTVVFFGLTWNLEHYQQVIGRVAAGIRGMQQGESVKVYHIVAKNTVEERLMATITHKGDVQDVLFKAMQEMSNDRRSQPAAA